MIVALRSHEHFEDSEKIIDKCFNERIGDAPGQRLGKWGKWTWMARLGEMNR
jgi:hypothetical protein